MQLQPIRCCRRQKATGISGKSKEAPNTCSASWYIVPTSPDSTITHLEDVAVAGPNDAWAVGYITNPPSQVTPLIIHWNGTAWSAVTLPISAGDLYGVTAIGPNDAWAVGADINDRTLTMHWNGTTWSVVPE